MSDNYAARVGDLHLCPAIDGASWSFLCFGGKPHKGGPIMPDGAPQVIIEGKHAVRVTDKLQCESPNVDMVVTGVENVLIHGLPAARLFSKTMHGGEIRLAAAQVIFNGAMVGCILGGGPNGAAAEACKVASKDREANAAKIKAKDCEAKVQKRPSQQNYENGCGPEAVRTIANGNKKPGDPGFLTEEEQLKKTGEWWKSDEETAEWKQRENDEKQSTKDESSSCSEKKHPPECRVYKTSKPFFPHSGVADDKRFLSSDGPAKSCTGYKDGTRDIEEFEVTEQECQVPAHKQGGAECKSYRVDVTWSYHAKKQADVPEKRADYNPNKDTTNADDQAELLNKNGTPASTQPLDPQAAAQAAAEGKGVIVPVDAGVWNGTTQDNQGHVVQVIGVEYDADGKPVRVFVNDTGDGSGEGCGKSVSWDHFQKSQERFKENFKKNNPKSKNGPKMVTTDKPVY